MRKTKAKRINFELFLYLLSVFHVLTEVEEKYKYIFRLYDTDKNMKIDAGDLSKIYRMIYTAPWMQEEDYSKLVTETLIKYGNKGEIRLENLRELIPEDEVREFLSFRFNNKFAWFITLSLPKVTIAILHLDLHHLLCTLPFPQAAAKNSHKNWLTEPLAVFGESLTFWKAGGKLIFIRLYSEQLNAFFRRRNRV